MDLDKKHTMRNLGIYLDLIQDARHFHRHEALLALYDELAEIGEDFSVPMERKDGEAYIYRDMDVIEAVCRMVGPDAAMLDRFPEMGCIACEGNGGWYQTRSFREIFDMTGGRDE